MKQKKVISEVSTQKRGNNSAKETRAAFTTVITSRFHPISGPCGTSSLCSLLHHRRSQKPELLFPQPAIKRKNITLTYPPPSCVKTAIKKFSDLPRLAVGTKTRIPERALPTPRRKDAAQRDQEPRQTGLAVFPSLSALDCILFVQSYFYTSVHALWNLSITIKFPLYRLFPRLPCHVKLESGKFVFLFNLPFLG